MGMSPHLTRSQSKQIKLSMGTKNLVLKCWTLKGGKVLLPSLHPLLSTTNDQGKPYCDEDKLDHKVYGVLSSQTKRKEKHDYG